MGDQFALLVMSYIWPHNLAVRLTVRTHMDPKISAQSVGSTAPAEPPPLRLSTGVFSVLPFIVSLQIRSPHSPVIANHMLAIRCRSYKRESRATAKPRFDGKGSLMEIRGRGLAGAASSANFSAARPRGSCFPHASRLVQPPHREAIPQAIPQASR